MQREFTLDEIQDVARNLLSEYKSHGCYAFYAEMGSGKTTLIHALCEELGVKDNVSSPTFSIINEYEGKDGLTIYHMDWYRLKNAEDAFEAGVQDILQRKDALVFIEWPEIAAELLDFPHVKVQLKAKDEYTRQLHAQAIA